MNCSVLGVRSIDYVNKQGRRVTGCRLYVSFEEHNTTGLACMDVFISSDILPPAIGDKIVLRYNRYGRCIGFDFAG